MMRVVRDNWDRNKDRLEEAIRGLDDFPYRYLDLVKIAFFNILGSERLNIDDIHEIDDGDYQGTKLFLIPFSCYQPGPYQYLMTYVYYGSCSGCDTLQAIESTRCGELNGDNRTVADLMTLCKDLLVNAICPYNTGWRTDPEYEEVEY